MAKARFRDMATVRRYLIKLLDAVERGEMPPKLADTLKGICNAIIITLQHEDKEKELELLDALEHELKIKRGDNKTWHLYSS